MSGPGSAPRLPRERRLRPSGRLARLERDELTDSGVVLLIDGTEQSHVEVDDPAYLLHDYAFRMAAAHRILGSPIGGEDPERSDEHALHLGAGALTLPRWVDEQRPRTLQTVVDYEEGLVDFVLEVLPMARPPRSVVADAAGVLRPSGALAGTVYDVVLADLFNGPDAPAALTGQEFLLAALSAVRPPAGSGEDRGGLLLLNLGDVPGSRFARELVARAVELLDGGPSQRPPEGPGSCWDRAALSAPADVIEGGAEGNLVLALRPGGPLESAETDALWAAGPHPGEVLSGAELRAWTAAG